MKLSGEALAGRKKTGFDEETVRGVALQVKELVDSGIQVGIVIGGGNFWRGRTSENIDRTKADQANQHLVHITLPIIIFLEEEEEEQGHIIHQRPPY